MKLGKHEKVTLQEVLRANRSSDQPRRCGDMLMPFDKIVGIDWSGALNEHLGGTIQVAEYDPQTGTARLAGPLQNPAAPWRRDDVLAYVQREVERSTVLVGLDFAFAYPYCDVGAYFPGENASPRGFQQLWATVEAHCVGVPNLYGRPFISDGSPFRRYHRVPGFLGDRYQIRHRMTEQQTRLGLGLNPTSIFHCIGPAAVGIGSMAGMRLLHQLHGMVCIWPFNVNGPPEGSTVVEIYPRVFLTMAENAGIPRTLDRVRDQCAHFGTDLQNLPVNPTGHQRDALVSTAGMGWLVRQGTHWLAPDDRAATYEGWIFGI